MEPKPVEQEPPALLYLAPLLEKDDKQMRQLDYEIKKATQAVLSPKKIPIEHYTITQEMARKLLCIKPDGTLQPTKKEGSNHAHDRVGNVYFKAQGHPLLNAPMEAALYYFYELFVGHSYIAPSCLIIIKNVKLQTPHNSVFTTQVAQASLAVEGITFHQFINHKIPFKELNLRAISAFYIAGLLTNPADYKAKNLMVRENDKVLTGIDNDEALVPSICLSPDKVSHKDRHYAGVKHILYCIPELMDTCIDPSLVKYIRSTNSKVKLMQWLERLQRYNENHAYLSQILESEDAVRELGFPLKLPKRTIKHIYTTFNQIKNKLKDHSNLKHSELLSDVQPLLTRYYTTITQNTYEQPTNENPCLKAYEIINTTTEDSALESILDLHAYVNNNDKRTTFRVLREERTTESAHKDDSNKITISQALEELTLLDTPHYVSNLFELHTLINKSVDDDEILQKKIAELINQGASLEAMDQDSNTALDCALEKGFSRLVSFLIKQGAGKNIKINRFTKFYQSADHTQELKKVLELLRERNLDVDWQLLLQDMLLTHQPASTAVPITCTTMPNPQKRYLPVSVSSQLWDEQGNFKRKNKYGRCDVSYAQYGKKLFWVKKFPQCFGFEYAVSSLIRQVSPHITSYIELVRSENIPYLFSFTSKSGENLQDLFDKSENISKNPLELDLLEPIQLGHLIIMTVITNQSDGKPDNLLVEDISTDWKNKLYRLVCIDNENALGPSRVRLQENGKPCRKTKSILFCLDQMIKPIPQEIRTYYSTINFVEKLRAWLCTLSRKHTPYLDLFKHAEAKVLWEKHNCFIGIPLLPGMVSRLYDRFLNIQRILEKNRHTTQFSYLDLLCKLDEPLGKSYKRGFSGPKPLTVYERFELVDKPLYGKTAHNTLLSKDNFQTLVSSEDISFEISLLDAIRKEANIGPKKALEELEEIRKNLNVNRLGTALICFKQLKLLSDKSRLLKSLDFGNTEAIPHTDQIQLLEEIAQSQLPWHYLCLKNAQALTCKIVQKCNLESVTKLDLRGCTNIEESILQILEERCLFLKYLNISRNSTANLCKRIGTREYLLLGLLPILERIYGCYEFSYLRQLIINDCLNLQRFMLRAPKLLKLKVNNCPLLQDLQLECPQIQDLDISNNVLITDEVLNKIVHQCSMLKLVKLDGCSKITYPEFRTLSPSYPVALLTNKPASIKALVIDLLSNRPTFTTLYLDDINLDDNGFYPLVEALKINSTVTTLHLGINKITTKGIEALAKALEENATLHTLHLGNAKFDNKGIDALNYALERNKTLKNLCLYTSAPEQIKQSLEQLSVQSNLDTVSLLAQNKLRKKIGKGIEIAHTLSTLPDE